MNREILTLETAQKLARCDKTIKYIKDKIKRLEKMQKKDSCSLCSKCFYYCGVDELYKVLEVLEGNNEIRQS